MSAKGANGVGRITVEVEVANYGDLIQGRRRHLAAGPGAPGDDPGPDRFRERPNWSCRSLL